VRSFRELVDATLRRLAEIGADPDDDEETRLRKGLLVLIAALILPISAVWGVLYLALGAPSGLVAFLYFGVSLASIALFAWSHHFALLLRIQLVAILLSPTLSMIPLGGFVGSGGVGLWGIMAPLGALVFGGTRAAIRWYVAFLAGRQR
jgi:adenylate cyclase